MRFRGRVGIRAAGAISAENLDGVELGLLGDTILGATNGAGDVSAVAVAIGVDIIDKVGSPGGTAAEVLRVLLAELRGQGVSDGQGLTEWPV